MKPLVSIITPSYNQGRFIRETIESVLGQDYENVEYIVIDGGSTDETLSILNEYKEKIHFISEPDSGQSNAINKGFRMAHGEIVAWLNSDDVYEPGCISNAVEYFINNPNLALVYSDGYIIDDKSNKLKVFEYTQEFDYWKLVNFWDYIMQPATFFKAEMLKEVGYLDEELNYCMDWDLWIKLASVGEVQYVNECWACSREYGETKTRTGGFKRLQEIKRLLRKYSKKRNPLGIASYRSSTLYDHLGVNELSKRLLRKYMAHVHEKLFAQMPIRYSDGWIGKEYKQIIPNCVDAITLYICCPDSRLLPQKVYISCNRKKFQLLYIKDMEKKTVVIANIDRDFSEYSLKCTRAIKLAKEDNRQLSLFVEM